MDRRRISPASASSSSRASTGSRKHSVLPEPVPDVTTTLRFAASLGASEVRSASA
jgi:hypothetical protein